MRILFLFLLIILGTIGYSQNQGENTIIIKGQVINEKEESIPFATLRIKGTYRGAATDAEGKFYFRANRNDTLVVNFIGYHEKQVALGLFTIKELEKLKIYLTLSPISLDSVQVFSNDPMKWLYRKKRDPITIKGIRHYNGPRKEPSPIGFSTGANGPALTGAITAFAN
ncbi:carboxypeptidase-like regulatory domain-containing protein, partial [Xanthovirga aplysinae]|uniref:carboxypeptidase-like regulatory domain-containing protein n=1 Tax=Xanthovirga aplysinae TaxID=2529853 RepID=UPI0016576281